MIRRQWLRIALGGAILAPLGAIASFESYIYQANGVGRNLKEARLDALNALSQQIISEVSSTTEQSVEVVNNAVNRKAKVDRKAKSNVLLKGVKFTTVSNKPNEVKVIAYFDSNALDQTIKYLQQITVFKLEALTLEDIPDLKSKVSMLLALLLAVPPSLRSKYKKDLQLAKQKFEFLNKRQSEALLIFNTLGKKPKIYIDGKLVDPSSKPIFVTPNRHDFKLIASGYKPFEGVINAHSGQLIKYTVDWIPDGQYIPVVLEISEQLKFISTDTWKDILNNVGLDLSEHSKLKLKVRVNDDVRHVDDFDVHNIDLSLSFVRNGQRLKRLRMHFSVSDYHGKTRALQKEFRKRIEKGLKVLVSKTEL